MLMRVLSLVDAQEFKYKKCYRKKILKDRYTFLLGCNVFGTDRLKMMVFEKRQNPSRMKGVNNLLIIYKANKMVG